MNGRQSSQALRANLIVRNKAFLSSILLCRCPGSMQCIPIASRIGVAKIVFDSNFTKPTLMFQCFLVDKFSSSQWAIIMKPEIINELRVLFLHLCHILVLFFFPLNFAFFFFLSPGTLCP